MRYRTVAQLRRLASWLGHKNFNVWLRSLKPPKVGTSQHIVNHDINVIHPAYRHCRVDLLYNLSRCRLTMTVCYAMVPAQTGAQAFSFSCSAAQQDGGVVAVADADINALDDDSLVGQSVDYKGTSCDVTNDPEWGLITEDGFVALSRDAVRDLVFAALYDDD
jgi:hypothetical protein